MHGLPTQTLVPLDETLADLAAHLTASARLRGADAVYAAVAQHYGTTLVTLDRQQLDRLALLVPTVRPADVLAKVTWSILRVRAFAASGRRACRASPLLTGKP